MKIEKGVKKYFEERYERLDYIKGILKTEFVGLDLIIDELIDLVIPWYCNPYPSLKPTIINLWGMTGVGKTSLVVRLFDLLEHKYLYKFNIGDFCGTDSNYYTNIKNSFTESILDVKHLDKPVFIFDEIQLGRTLYETGEEKTSANLSGLWELYDTGKIVSFEDAYDLEKLYTLFIKIKSLIDIGVKAKNGIVVKGLEKYKNFFKDDKNDDNFLVPPGELWLLEKNILKTKNLVLPDSVTDMLNNMDEKQTLDFIKERLEDGMKPTQLDLTNSLIFNIGNLDGVYGISNEVNPDITADELSEYVKDINIVDIKKELLKLFRPEQISRFGNNHVIYKAFNEKDYYDLIKLELNKINEEIKEIYDISISFDETLIEIIYKEGVFPTQGARPLFSTINTIITSYISKFVKEILQINKNITNIEWKYVNKKYVINFISKNKKVLTKEYDLLLKTEINRENSSDEEQYLTALHESGHIVSALYFLNLIPKYAVSKTVDSSMGGFCLMDQPELKTKEYYLNYISYLLGGHTAELLFLDSNNLTGGASADIEAATTTVLKMFKLYGMYGTPITSGHPDGMTDISIVSDSILGSDEESVRVIQNRFDKCYTVLEREKKLLFKLTEYLINQNKIEAKEIEKLVELYGVDKPNIKTMGDYYGFKEKINNYLKNL